MAAVQQLDSKETIEEEAVVWLVRLDRDNGLEDSELVEMQAWAARSPAHRAELLRISAFWNANNVLTELSIPLRGRAGSERGQNRGMLNVLFPYQNFRGIVVAMCFLLSFFAFKDWLIPPAIDSTNGIYATAIGEVRLETLVDGSQLEINTDSQVQVDYSGSTRKLRLLRGEVHFSVSHNEEWPFEVYAGGSKVGAVGTAFLLRLNDDALNVIVTDGKVDLSALSDSSLASKENPLQQYSPALEKFARLSVGEGLTFNSRSASPEPKIMEKSEIIQKLAWRKGYLVFSGEPLSLVVEELNRYQIISVEILGPELGALPIGGRFKIGELDALFDALNSNFGIQVNRVDDGRIQLLKKQINR